MSLLTKNLAALLEARQDSIFLQLIGPNHDRYNGSADSDTTSDSRERISSSRITLTLAALR